LNLVGIDSYVYPYQSYLEIENLTYVKNKYGDELEFLWEKSPKTAVVRRKTSKKWYALILSLSKRKLNLDTDETAEIINLHNSPEEIEKLIDNKRYFNQLKNYNVIPIEEEIVEDNNLFTCSGPGNALELSFRLLEKLTSKKNLEIVKKNMFLK